MLPQLDDWNFLKLLENKWQLQTKAGTPSSDLQNNLQDLRHWRIADLWSCKNGVDGQRKKNLQAYRLMYIYIYMQWIYIYRCILWIFIVCVYKHGYGAITWQNIQIDRPLKFNNSPLSMFGIHSLAHKIAIAVQKPTTPQQNITCVFGKTIYKLPSLRKFTGWQLESIVWKTDHYPTTSHDSVVYPHVLGFLR